jgi:hypothetical protein
MVYNLSEGSRSTVSNLKMSVNLVRKYFKEEETIHQNDGKYGLGYLESHATNIEQYEAHNKHNFN